jgi:hypothetical protein
LVTAGLVAASLMDTYIFGEIVKTTGLKAAGKEG